MPAIHINLMLRKFFFVLEQQQTKSVIRKLTYRTQFVLLKYRFDGVIVESTYSTIYKHEYIVHLASYRNQPFTTGSWSPLNQTESHTKTEIMNLETGKWTTKADYPDVVM